MYNSLVDYVLERGINDQGQFRLDKSTNPNLFNHKQLLQYLLTQNYPHKIPPQQNQTQSSPIAPIKNQSILSIRDKQDNDISNDSNSLVYNVNRKARISDLKASEIPSQLNYLSQKIHLELSRKYLNLDSDLHRLQQLWLIKKIPQFYCYYFIKFSYANSYSRLHELILAEIQNMSKQKDSYTMIRRTIEAREVCLQNLRKQLSALREKDILESLETIAQENQLRHNIRRQHHHNYQQLWNNDNTTVTKNKGKNNQLNTSPTKLWKNKLELVFELVEHLRKLTVYCVELIKSWKQSVYTLTEDPRKFRERIIFYHTGTNYLLKMLTDTQFLNSSPLNGYLELSKGYDPFLLKPVMLLQNRVKINNNNNNKVNNHQDWIWLELIRPKEKDLSKIVQSLIILAQQQYDEDRHSGFIHKNNQLQTRKLNIALKRDKIFSVQHNRRDTVNNGHTSKKNMNNNDANLNKNIATNKRAGYQSSEKKLLSPNRNQYPSLSNQLTFPLNQSSVKNNIENKSSKNINNVMSSSTNINNKLRSQSMSKLSSSVKANNLQNLSHKQLSKLSPYLSRNELLKKAQQVLQFEHNYKVAQRQYLENISKPNKHDQISSSKNEQQLRTRNNASRKQSKEKLTTFIDQISDNNNNNNKNYPNSNQMAGSMSSNRIFNKYIEESVRQLDEANKRKYLFQNHNASNNKVTRNNDTQSINTSPFLTRSPVKTNPSLANNNNTQNKQQRAMSYNKVSYIYKKEAEYERNLHKYTRIDSINYSNYINGNNDRAKDNNPSKYYNSLEKFHHQYSTSSNKPAIHLQNQKPSPNKHSNNNRIKPISNSNLYVINKQKRPIIQISDRGIKAGHQIVTFTKNNSIINLQKHRQNQQFQQKSIEQQSQKEEKLINRTNQNTKQHLQETNKNKLQSQIQLQTNPENLFTTQSPNQVIILRQQPQKLQQLKQSLYNQIKQELLQELKNQQSRKKDHLENMLEQEKQRRINQILEQRKQEEQRKRQEEERMRLAQLDKQRKKLSIPIRIQPIQYAEQNLNEWYNEKLFAFHKDIFKQMFIMGPQKQFTESIGNSLHCIFLQAYLDDKEVGYAILQMDESNKHLSSHKLRRFNLKYIVVKEVIWLMSTLHQALEFLWKNDPLEQINFQVHVRLSKQSLKENMQKKQMGQQQLKQSKALLEQQQKILTDFVNYAQRLNANLSQSYPYSNIKSTSFTFYRNTSQEINQNSNQITYDKQFLFSSKFHLKTQLLCSTQAFSEMHNPIIDNTLQSFTSYVFLLQEIFRKYLTPDQIIQLRENSSNIRRLKDIFRVILEIEKTDPKVQELKIIQGIGLDDLYQRLRDKIQRNQQETMEQFQQKYYWNIFSDKVKDNRLLLSVLETHLALPYHINTAVLGQKNYLRININSNILVLKSSIYPSEYIYLLPTDNPKIRLFFMNGEAFKLMRIELFVFLNLVFNNIVSDSERFISGMWVPQFSVTESKHSSNKLIKRITDFSLSMKKHFYLSEQIFFCNHAYIKNGILPIVKNNDIIFLQSTVVGLMHTDVEKASTGMPLYAKLIDKQRFF